MVYIIFNSILYLGYQIRFFPIIIERFTIFADQTRLKVPMVSIVFYPLETRYIL